MANALPDDAVRRMYAEFSRGNLAEPDIARFAAMLMPSTPPTSTIASSPRSLPISVHGRLNENTFREWLGAPLAKLRANGAIAIILDGSESMSMARNIVEKIIKEHVNFTMLHAHLNDEKVVRPDDGKPFCLLATETLYRRELTIQLDAVYDDCQVHRESVEDVPTFGLVATLKTFLVPQPDLDRRLKWGSANAAKVR